MLILGIAMCHMNGLAFLVMAEDNLLSVDC